MLKRFLSVLALLGSCQGSAAVSVKLQPLIERGLDPTVSINFAPGASDTFYVIEQKGNIRQFLDGKLQEKPILDIRSQVSVGPESGLLSMAFHPDFASNQRYFINYNQLKGTQLQTVIAELKMGSPERKELLVFDQPYSNHNGGQLAFDSAGFLYIGVGDGGSAGDPENRSQNLGTLLGKILRVRVDQEGVMTTPMDNPFQKPGQRKEIFAYGLRNPWRFSFDTVGGNLWVADVGQDKLEEINLVERAGNYGWNIQEGTNCYPAEKACDKKGLVQPVYEYSRTQGNSITGGYVYRGSLIPELTGAYVYGDFGSGKVWALWLDAKTKAVARHELLLNTHMPISSFGQDAKGEIYVAHYQGKVFRIVPKS